MLALAVVRVAKVCIRFAAVMLKIRGRWLISAGHAVGRGPGAWYFHRRILAWVPLIHEAESRRSFVRRVRLNNSGGQRCALLDAFF